MTEQTPSVNSDVDAQQPAVANTIDAIVDQAVKEDNEAQVETEESAVEATKELSPAEELEKLRRAKARDDRRIGKLTAQKYQYQKEAEELRTKYNSSPQQTSQQNGELSPAKTGIPTKLNPANFNNWSDYSEARAEEIADYKIDKKFSEHEGKQKETENFIRESTWESERTNVADRQMEPFSKETPDAQSLYDEYADVIRELPKEIKHAFLAADNVPLALYNLAKEGKLEDLAQMSLVDAKVEIRLSQMKQPAKPKTKAPAPLPAARGSVSGGRKPEDLSGDEIRSWLRSS